RPTAVNLFWALDRMSRIVDENKDLSVSEIQKLLYSEADAIREEDVMISRNIGEIGFNLLSDLKKDGKPVGILTHCNAGTLATAKYGTATAPMYIALEKGWAGDDMHVYCDETRPLLQGIRLTSFELSNAGIQTTVQCDNMAAVLMEEGKIDIIFVGCDRVARNGDAANKIGTNTLAILAKHYGIPFYICAPTSTIDMAAADKTDIPIEIRDPDEVTETWYSERMAPPGIDVFNPAFDVSDHTLLTGIITEKGMCQAPYDQAFEAIGL
ncbi:MAG: S-methyl-5-thioribose-1-phosphate isomerase, partial [Clostridiaceae bacterium]|nr:S-methyl-5-thioribose-1-phosphate isomerase [Clostridiaceae bacterium]